jgi:hypothetical protein
VSKQDKKLPPFPFEAVRDLLGILRALYAADKSRGASERRLSEIRAVALELRRATDLARDHEPASAGHRAAWERADRATSRLADLVDVTTPLEPTLLAAGQRVRAGAPSANDRENERRARRIRS